MILKIPFHYQRHALTCEMAALRMAAEYFGVVRSEQELLRLMPHEPAQPRLENAQVIWADPNHAFPGNIRGWQLYRGGMAEHPDRARRGLWGYGVHAPAIAGVAARLGLWADLFYEAGAVYRFLDRRRVPIVLVPDGGRSEAALWSWTTPQGSTVAVMNAEHSVVVRAYDDAWVWVHDPKGKVGRYSRGVFEKAFGLLRSGVAIGPPFHHVPGRDRGT